MNPGYYIIIGVISALLFILLLIIGIRYFKRKGQKNLGKNIEQQIDPLLSLDNLVKKANFFAQDRQYVHAIIYLFYYFRKFSEKYYHIKNAIAIDHGDFPQKLAGFDSISINNLKKVLAIYEIAYFNSESLTHEDFLQVKNFILGLSTNP